MKTVLADVLHLYKGCEVQIDSDNFMTESVRNLITTKFLYLTDRGFAECKGYCVQINELKPILRPLSDITVGELAESFKSIHPHNWQDYPETQFAPLAQAAIFFPKSLRPLGYYTPHLTSFLLAHGFDLFGLIESGQAIDKTKL